MMDIIKTPRLAQEYIENIYGKNAVAIGGSGNCVAWIYENETDADFKWCTVFETVSTDELYRMLDGCYEDIRTRSEYYKTIAKCEAKYIDKILATR